MKKIRIPVMLLLALTLTLGLAAASHARMGMGMGMGMNLTPEQAGQMFDLRQKFMNETADLRKQMAIKRAELAALWKAENPDQNQIQAKQKEMNALRDQMQERATAFRLQARKIAPQGFMGGMGRGCGMGPGGGMGGPGL